MSVGAVLSVDVFRELRKTTMMIMTVLTASSARKPRRNSRRLLLDSDEEGSGIDERDAVSDSGSN